MYDNPPEVKPVDEDALFCFLSMSRVCNADCAAFIPERSGEKPHAWRRCRILDNINSLAKGMLGIFEVHKEESVKSSIASSRFP